MVTVQDILEIPDLDLKLLAGGASTGSTVRWAHVAEPPVDWLRGGELLLTSSRTLAGSDEEQAALVQDLVDRGVVGLGCGLRAADVDVPATLVAAAERCGLPLFEVPRHVPLSAINEAVAVKVINEHYSLLRRSVAVYEKLMTSVLEERGLEPILSTLTSLVGCSCVLFDSHGAVLSEVLSRRRSGRLDVSELWRAIADRRAERATFRVVAETGFGETQVVPVMAAHSVRGLLVVAKDSGSYTQHDRVVMRNVVTAIALELVQRKAVAEAEQRLVGDFLEQLTARRLPAEELLRRLAYFGLDPRAPHLFLIVDPDARITGSGAAGDEVTPPAQPRWAVDKYLAERRQSWLSAPRDNGVVVLLEPEGVSRDAIRSLAEDLHVAVEDALKTHTFSVGIGGCHVDPTELRRSYFEAQYALRARRLRGATSVVADDDDLGSYRLFLGLQDESSLEAFHESVLGRLRDHDNEHSSELLKSLTGFLEANGHWGDAADRLYVHRHTLRYRMRRVEEITGRDLSDSQDRMDFWLAIKALEFVAGDDVSASGGRHYRSGY
ncbi:MAG: PucR family transcriptional regulator ligand-binding domain-containing protein [Thermoleophilia bacterium]